MAASPIWKTTRFSLPSGNAGAKLLRNRVTDAEIAEVLSRWTGIPVARMLEGEREKLLQMEENCISVSLGKMKP